MNITKEQLDAVQELMTDYEQVLFFAQKDKNANEVAFHNGSFVADYYKNKTVIDKLFKMDDKLKAAVKKALKIR